MTTIEERTAMREAALRAATSGQRRLARPEDYVYDKAQEAFWDLQDGTLHTEKAVDASIPIELWRVEVEEAPAEDAPRGRGRPRQRRERLGALFMKKLICTLKGGRGSEIIPIYL